MNWYQKLYYFVLASTFITQLVMVSLQIRAFKRHRHLSFLLLSVATACGLLYIVASQILGALRGTAFPPPLWIFACATVPLFAQMIVGVWGTVCLFRSYRQLSVATGPVTDVRSNV
jgi:protein-S-isoprenylcysteine O-methyltransferase Ste14